MAKKGAEKKNQILQQALLGLLEFQQSLLQRLEIGNFGLPRPHAGLPTGHKHLQPP
jgi:hypothetical protein